MMGNVEKMQKAREKSEKAITEGALLGRVYRTFPSSEYLVLDQVRSHHSVRARTADAMAIGLWASRDTDLHGFEFKSSRGSWLQELKEPAKAEELAQFCDYWWLVAADETVVKVEELPKNWGLYIPDKKEGLSILVQAPKLSPKAPDKVFLSSLLKNLKDKNTSSVTEQDLKLEYERGKREGYREGETRAVEGKDAMIDWLNGELYRQNMKLEASEGLMKTGLNLGSAELAMWGKIITEFNASPLKKYQRIDNLERVREILDAILFLKNAPVETIEKRFMLLKSVADDLSRLVALRLDDLQLLGGTDPAGAEDKKE